ncbi:potassium channel GORK isoform X2 [Salmo trutta]|uniref:potassium channel GORK isoform X2 n=1 Tax=Salmo trutta TaxID=8032 RepID=UPI00113167C6|nr:potassium channel GORK-like isoform X2 [Salmo trutta]
MGIYQSKGKIPEEVYRFWSAVASSIRLGWLGTDDMAKEMKVCQLAIFPMLLNASALQGDIVGLEGHLQQGADVSVSDGHGRTPLHLAAGEGDVETVRFLLKKGADVNVRDFARETALRDGIRCNLAFLGDFKQMEVWKQAGVSFNFADADGRTPLHVAVCTNQPDMVRFCIRNGSSLEQRDLFNNQPVDDARRLGLQTLVEMLSNEAQKEVSDLVAEKTKINVEDQMARGLVELSLVP